MTDMSTARSTRTNHPPVRRFRHHERQPVERPRVRFPGWERLAVVALAVTAGVLLRDQGPVAAVPLVAAVLLAADSSGLRRCERTSLRPLRRFVTHASAALLVVVAVGWFDLAELRTALASIAVVLAVPVAVRVGRLWRGGPCTTVLVGDTIAVRHLLTQWEARPEVCVVGICLTSTPDASLDEPAQILGVPVIGDLDDVAQLAVEREVDQVVVVPGPVVSAYDVRRLSWALERTDIELSVATEVHGAVPRRIEPRLLGKRLLLSVRPARPSWPAVVVKEGLDRIVAAALLILLGPVILSLIVLVRLDSPGPGLFRQVRAGKAGRPFTMYKLRTMTADAEKRLAELSDANEAAGLLFKMAHDPRVTRMGGVLRRTSLDELPQLLNVVLGSMSLIGPRPALLSETDEYDQWIRRRLGVKPGMTGLWQVSGRSRLEWNEAVRLDLDYVDNWTLGGDMAIALRTVDAVMRRDGAV